MKEPAFSELQHFLRRRTGDPHHHLLSIPWKDRTNPNGVVPEDFHELRSRVDFLIDAVNGTCVKNRRIEHVWTPANFQPELPPWLHAQVLSQLAEMESAGRILGRDIEMNQFRIKRGDPRGVDEQILLRRRQEYFMRWMTWTAPMMEQIKAWWHTVARRRGSKL